MTARRKSSPTTASFLLTVARRRILMTLKFA
jgi:hypothetical protein